MNRLALFLPFLCLLVAGLAAWNGPTEPASAYYAGEKVALGSGTAHVYVLRDEAGRTTEFGVALSAAVYENNVRSTPIRLDFPAIATGVPYRHLFLSPQVDNGSPYQALSGFNAHFVQHVQPAYRCALPVAEAGVRWADVPPGGFATTYAINRYDGSAAVVEPEAVRQWVKAREAFETTIHLPAEPAGGFAARSYGFRFDAARQEYQFYQRDFVGSGGAPAHAEL